MKLSRRSAFAAAAAAAISLAPALAADATGEFPLKGWHTGGSAPQEYDFGTTHVDGVSGKCAFIEAKIDFPPGDGTLSQKISAENYRGQRLRLSGQLKTDGAGQARFWMVVDGQNGKMLTYYGMADKPVVGTTDWTRYDLVLDVPSNAADIVFGYALYGGTAWARDFKLEPVGKDVPVSALAHKPLPNAPVNMGFNE